MKINNAVYQSSASYKLLNTTFAAIVNEAFMDALPFNRLDMSEENERTLAEYTLKVVESFGGFDTLTYAMNNEKDPAKKQFLSDMRDVCLETANRVISRVSSGKKEVAREDMVAPTLDKKEYAEYVEKADKLDLDRVAEIVKEKVLKTLDEEREARARNDEVNQALKEAIASQDEEFDHSDDEMEDEEDTDEEDTSTEDEDEEDSEEDSDSEDEEDEEDEKKDKGKKKDDSSDDDEDDLDATESFLTRISGGALRRPDQHKSFFNSILNKAMEQIVATENVAMMDTEEISKDRILDLTLESTLPDTFITKASPDRALDFVMSYTNSQKLNKDERKTVVESALVDATIAYTMIETLHTMNLVKPSVMDLKAVTEAYNPIQRKYNDMKTIVASSVAQTIRNARPRFNMTKYEKIDALESGIENLTKLNQSIPTDDPYFDKSHQALSSAIESMQSTLKELNAPVNVRKETVLEQRVMEGYKAQMNKIASLVDFYHGRAHKVVLEHYAGSPVMDVKIYGVGYDPLITTHITMEGFNGGASEMIGITHGTKLDEKDMPSVFYKKMDGSGKEVMIH